MIQEPPVSGRLLFFAHFARENGYTLRGRHYEIYLGDPRRAKPENLKTVLRHPIQKAEE